MTDYSSTTVKTHFSELRGSITYVLAVPVDMGVFAAEIEFPDPVFPERQPQDLRIATGSAAADAALLMPNINDGFTGKAPDIGAYEIGKPQPHYGPRPRGVNE